MKKVSHVLKAALNDEDVVAAARALTILRDWASIVGPDLAKRSRPDRYTKGVVWIAVKNSGWAQELRLNKEKILDRLHEYSGQKQLFKDLRFGVRPMAVDSNPEQDVRAIELTKDTPLSIREIAERRLAKLRGAGVEGPKDPGA
jgi:predicted nucleic acid-binding Zn ribbon protein